MVNFSALFASSGWTASAHRALLESAAALAMAAPIVAVAAWRTRTRQWRVLVVACVLFVLDELVFALPRAHVFVGLQWNWQTKIIEFLWPFALAGIGVFTLREIGVTSRIARGWQRPVIGAILCAITLPAAFFVAAHARETMKLEGWLFQLSMPGLAEEIVYRGVFLSLLDRAFGRPWRILGAEIGWALVITSVLFAVVHVVYLTHGKLQYDWPSGIGPMMGSLIGGWLRERVDSVWPVVILHNVSNLVIPILSFI